MSIGKYVDKICIAVAGLTLMIAILFLFREQRGITSASGEGTRETDAMFSQNDLDADWDVTGATVIFLNGDSAEIAGNGAYFSDGILYIVYAGKYVISGTLEGSVRIEADGSDKIRLLFDGVEIASKTEAPIYIKQADKVFLTLKEDSQNTLTFENDDEDTECDGCIFSRDDLTINGKGNLTVVSTGLHGIVCNDSLVFAGGDICVTAKKDAVHAHDAIKICNTALAVSTEDDGLHVGNDDKSGLFYLESGRIDITECYEGIEGDRITIAGGVVNIVSRDDGINANGNENSTWITISGGDIRLLNPSGRDADGLDSNGDINISGGNLFVSIPGVGTNSAIDYGSENGGQLIISGGTVVACGSSQMAEAPAGDSPQGFIMKTVSGKENDAVSVTGSNGECIISEVIPYSFTSILISSPDITTGDAVTLKIGDEETDLTVSNTAEGGMGGWTGENGPFERKDLPEGREPFERGEQAPFGQGEQAPFGQGEQAPFGQGEQAPFGQGEQAPFGQDEQATYGEGEQAPFRQGEQDRFGQEGQAPPEKGGMHAEAPDDSAEQRAEQQVEEQVEEQVEQDRASELALILTIGALLLLAGVLLFVIKKKR